MKTMMMGAGLARTIAGLAVMRSIAGETSGVMGGISANPMHGAQKMASDLGRGSASSMTTPGATQQPVHAPNTGATHAGATVDATVEPLADVGSAAQAVDVDAKTNLLHVAAGRAVV